MKSALITSFLLLFMVSFAHALPNSSQLRELSDAEWRNLPVTELFRQGGVDFTAIVALSNCSGGLVRFQTSLGSDHAMILTNGHCLDLPTGFLEPGKIVLNEPVVRSFRLLKGDGKESLGALTSTRVIYATMTRTDMALYGLKETYDQIEKTYGVRALTISSAHPVSGRLITIPSGYWKRIYQCSIDRFVNELREDRWVWTDSILYLQPGCATIHGTSGSPVIDTQTYEVIGINNTGNDGGGRCTMNNPCEVDTEGNVTVTRKASYGQQLFWIYGCLDSQNEVDLSIPGCLLPKGI